MTGVTLRGTVAAKHRTCSGMRRIATAAEDDFWPALLSFYARFNVVLRCDARG